MGRHIFDVNSILLGYVLLTTCVGIHNGGMYVRISKLL